LKNLTVSNKKIDNSVINNDLPVKTKTTLILTYMNAQSNLNEEEGIECNNTIDEMNYLFTNPLDICLTEESINNYNEDTILKHWLILLSKFYVD